MVSTCQVEGQLLGSDVLVWSPEAVDLLRTNWRIVGNLVGTLPQKPMQNLHLGPPLLLLPEEVSLLLHKGSPKGVLEVHGDLPPTTPHHSTAEHQRLKDSVFRDLWEQGYYLTSGLKYGGDFLVYPDSPSRTHSSHIAIVLPWKQPSSTLASVARVAAKVKKNILLCSAEDEHISYYTMEWAGIT